MRRRSLTGLLDDEVARLDVRQHDGGERLYFADLGLHDAGALDLGPFATFGHAVAALRPVAGGKKKQARQNSSYSKHDTILQ
jgi:hypothetical protein